jgi:heme-degrading monooxygenase HmoA
MRSVGRLLLGLASFACSDDGFLLRSPFRVRSETFTNPRKVFAKTMADDTTSPTDFTLKKDVTTVMAFFKVDPSQQQDLVETITAFLPTVQGQSGFVSGSLLKSIDGNKVAHYTQWCTLADYEAFTKDDKAKIQGQKLAELGTLPDVHVYEIVA